MIYISTRLSVTALSSAACWVSYRPLPFDLSPSNSCQQFEGKYKLKVGKEIFITFDWHSRRLSASEKCKNTSGKNLRTNLQRGSKRSPKSCQRDQTEIKRFLNSNNH